VRLSQFFSPFLNQDDHRVTPLIKWQKKLCHCGTIHPFNYQVDHALKFAHFKETSRNLSGFSSV